MATIQIPVEPPASRTQDQQQPALLRLGFRPFYLLAAIFAVIAVPGWLLQRQGILPPGYLQGLHWHQHEMIFGFVAAVIVGFLFTAGRVWTGLPTPHGKPLLAFVLLWLSARIMLPFTNNSMGIAIDLSFLPAAAFVLAQLVWRSRTWRHLPIVAALVGLAVCNLGFHLAMLQVIDIDPTTAIHAALGFIVMLVQTMAGRVIPGFTANALPDARIRRISQLTVAAHLVLGIAMIAVVTGLDARLTAVLTLTAAVLHFAHLWCWDSFATRHKPILWILHLSYAWIPIGLVMMAAASMGWIPASLAWHALTVGAMSGMIAGMITRTALGHTGRPLVAGKAEIAFYVLIQLAALTRVFIGIVEPHNYEPGLQISATLWSLAFLIYVMAYLPILARARIDGRAG